MLKQVGGMGNLMNMVKQMQEGGGLEGMNEMMANMMGGGGGAGMKMPPGMPKSMMRMRR